jgi:hypothetical protein
LAEQIENEHRQAAKDLKSQTQSYLEELGSVLLDLAQLDTFIQQDVTAIRNLLMMKSARIP